MIVGKLKPVEEIIAFVSNYKKVAVLGCGGCVSVCLTGGDREARALACELGQQGPYPQAPPEFTALTIERQCERDMVESFLEIPAGTEAILSTACGAGVQMAADVFGHLPVMPALNTTFLGAFDGPGLWRENCRGCGDCVLGITGGLCPVARCSKQLFNGPCGGSSGGKCEISDNVDCVWQLIIERLKERGRLSECMAMFPVKNWSKDRGGGPRKMTKTANQF
jgi:ferredoxin